MINEIVRKAGEQIMGYLMLLFVIGLIIGVFVLLFFLHSFRWGFCK